jgi:DNA polymerase
MPRRADPHDRKTEPDRREQDRGGPQDPPSAAPWVPADRSLEALAGAAAGCRGCDLWEHATQTVFGAGGAQADLLLVGEQPGDVEDRRGEPFVGPAGGLLQRAMREAGIDPDRVYLTNAVKHFRFERRSNGRRIHKSPGTTEIVACRPWLDAELEAVQAPVVVALGAVAARSLFGPGTKVSEPRPPFAWRDRIAVVSIHPSAALRAPDERRGVLLHRLVDDRRAAAAAVSRADSTGRRRG